ncbi:FKBP-type peptidylprolyl isomerase [Mycolicibacterium rhodesiae JS60]|nr:FKBP-type peptidylprolyl isomerase [Mycolicibacterium rhodesiae JS60]
MSRTSDGRSNDDFDEYLDDDDIEFREGIMHEATDREPTATDVLDL